MQVNNLFPTVCLVVKQEGSIRNLDKFRIFQLSKFKLINLDNLSYKREQYHRMFIMRSITV